MALIRTRAVQPVATCRHISISQLLSLWHHSDYDVLVPTALAAPVLILTSFATELATPTVMDEHTLRILYRLVHEDNPCEPEPERNIHSPYRGSDSFIHYFSPGFLWPTSRSYNLHFVVRAYFVLIHSVIRELLVHGQVTIIFVVSVGLSVCLFVQSFSQPSLIRFRSN